MFVYVAKTFTATGVGSRVKEARCEKCRTEFFYEMRKLGVGQSSAPYMIGQDSAKRSAADIAQKDLEKKLATAEDTVACPACYWVNESAIRQYRRAHHRGWYWFMGLPIFFGLLMDVIFYFDAPAALNHPPSLGASEIWITTLVAAIIALGALAIQIGLRRGFDPNRRHINGFPRLPPGTPPALVKNAAGELVVAPTPAAAIPEAAQWAIFRAGQLQFEPLCCVCLATGTDVLKLPMAARPALPVPLCRPCLARIRRQFWLRNLAVVPVAFLAGWLIGQVPDGIDLIGRLMITGFLGLFISAVAFCIIDHFLRPYRLGTADKENAVGKISFKNPAYTALMVRKIAQSDGIS